jgi:hypothetical protein
MFLLKWVEGGLSRQEMFDDEADAIERYDELDEQGIFWIDLEESESTKIRK